MSSNPFTVILKRYSVPLSCAALLMLGEAVATLLVPWLGGRFAELFIQERPTANLLVYVVVLLLAFLAQAILRFGANYIASITSENIRRDLRTRIYDHLQALPVGYFQQRRLGSILSLITSDALHVSNFIAGSLVSTLPLLFVVVGAAAQMLRINSQLACLALLLIPLFIFMIKMIGRRLRPLTKQLQEEEASATAILEENLSQVPAIKEFTREAFESARYAAQANRIADVSTRLALYYAALEPAVQFLASGAIVALVWLAAPLLIQGTLPLDQLVSFFLYALLLGRPIGSLASVFGQYQLAAAANARLTAALATSPEAVVPLLTDDTPSNRFNGRIEFQSVNFSYPERPPVLRNLDFDINAGEVVALTGENGAGKSTLVHLLLRLYEPDTGHILIDGRDIADISLHSLRKQIGIVPQNVLLTNASVADNIRFANPDASMAHVEDAARLAQAHTFIGTLPEGYETRIGDNGVLLSGGQRQRIALARALLKDPPILVLDEATAMFDPQSEISFVTSCSDALAGRTVILITHRPASLALASRIVVLENGQISSRGHAPEGVVQ